MSHEPYGNRTKNEQTEILIAEMASQALAVRMFWRHVGLKAGSEGGGEAQPHPVQKKLRIKTHGHQA
jgi:hypothetical protein